MRPRLIAAEYGGEPLRDGGRQRLTSMRPRQIATEYSERLDAQGRLERPSMRPRQIAAEYLGDEATDHRNN